VILTFPRQCEASSATPGLFQLGFETASEAVASPVIALHQSAWYGDSWLENQELLEGTSLAPGESVTTHINLAVRQLSTAEAHVYLTPTSGPGSGCVTIQVFHSVDGGVTYSTFAVKPDYSIPHNVVGRTPVVPVPINSAAAQIIVTNSTNAAVTCAIKYAGRYSS